jgi:hypothetical protein
MNLTFATHTILLIKYVIDRLVDVNAFIVTGDITSLYTNMDIKRSIDEVAEIFASHPDPKRPDKAILSWILPYGLTISSLQVNFFIKFLAQLWVSVSHQIWRTFTLLNLTKPLSLIL